MNGGRSGLNKKIKEGEKKDTIMKKERKEERKEGRRE